MIRIAIIIILIQLSTQNVIIFIIVPKTNHIITKAKILIIQCVIDPNSPPNPNCSTMFHAIASANTPIIDIVI